MVLSFLTFFVRGTKSNKRNMARIWAGWGSYTNSIWL